MSSWWFRRKAPGDETTPDSGYDAFFVADGTAGTINGALYRKDSSGGLHLIDPSLVDYELWPILAPGAATTPATGFARLFVGDGTGGTTAGSLYTKNSAGAVTAIGPPASSGSRLMQLYSSGGATPITGRGATTSGTSETFLFTVNVPAGSVVTGSTFRVAGYSHSTLASEYALSLRAGPTGTLSDPLLCLVDCVASGAGISRWAFNLTAHLLSVGSAATVVGHGDILSGNGDVFPVVDLASETAQTVDTTNPWYLSVGGRRGGGSVAIAVEIATVEAL